MFEREKSSLLVHEKERLLFAGRYVNFPRMPGQGHGPRREHVSRSGEARNGSNAANYAAKDPAGFKGSL